MLTTQQDLFRHFWHAVMPLEALAGGPVPFRLLGVDIVLFLGEDGEPRALRDRCRHRTARLSRGWCEKGRIVCGYHGWTYDGTGRLVSVPQFDDTQPVPDLAVERFWCTARYGYAWVSLSEPIEDIFDVPEDRDPGFRRIHQFYDTWNTAPLRMMENSFDNAHFAFVHRATFGDVSSPRPKRYEVTETEYGFFATSTVDILNPPEAHAITGETGPRTERRMQNHWFLPFSRRMDMEYPSGIRHIIINCATPIEDGRIQLVQILYRNDREEDCPAARLIEWDRRITEEDRAVLESTDCDATIDIATRREAHMPSDRPGIIMRKRLLDLLHQNGEAEIRRPDPPPARPLARGAMRLGPGAAGTIAVTIATVAREAERVVALTLVSPSGEALPPFTAGAHVDMHVATGIVRQYSLCSDPADRQRYRVAVLLEAQSRGGSATIHEAFHVGRRVRITPPRNRFALDETAPRHLLVAGGIGVTPLIAMAWRLYTLGADFTLHLCAHNRATAPFLAELEAAPFAHRLVTHLSGENPAERFAALATLAAEEPGAHAYVCGPERLQREVAEAAATLGWDPARVHAERFTADVDRDGEPFTVVAARSNVTLDILPGQSIATRLAEHDVIIPVSCEQGVCGTCLTRVLDGPIDHRDIVLSETERASGTLITACCSRGLAGSTLRLDV